MIKLIGFVAIFTSAFAFANNIASSSTEIVALASYNQYGGGDVIFKLKDPIEQCTGYFLSKSDDGFNANVSMIIAAYQAKTKVKVWGIPEQKWAGSSSGYYCKLYVVAYGDF
ncbi:hypothetical protein HG263_16540 [Pseudoalteromonas sp. JBTF-M23]|uniref:Uncharacterized protein n=1 Tax=Pseudoalteromonas caenipelagi TaxID=2726988 RepID=A0A849VEJ6_9GAMM|nr:hypothetical protein [Pseudoalteromonas caenipelagi]NOU52139.1 hypothetical protein [Pseudoalteromonas caenipelagi]